MTNAHCPTCGRCRECGAPRDAKPTTVTPGWPTLDPWTVPFQPTTPTYPLGPIWVAPLTPEQGAPYFTTTNTIAVSGTVTSC